MTAATAQAADLGTATYENGKFVNSRGPYSVSMSNMIDMGKAYFSADRKSPKPTAPQPMKMLTPQMLEAAEGPVAYRLGHSTMLLKLDNQFLLTDPMFSDRASMVSFAGPKRFHPTPIAMDDLPDIKAVIISHDHYDHLDKASIQALQHKVEHFYTPLKVGEYLRDWGIPADKITELDWWQSAELGSYTFTATPAQHFSGRGLFDRDQTLWASWVIQSQDAKVFFSGDSGYFDGFKAIGEKYGPFDLTMIETGAYNELWSEIHMMPHQSLQAHIDLRGKAMLPIHNSTFDLALHDWQEPLSKVTAFGQSNSVTVMTPMFGETVQINAPQHFANWWTDTGIEIADNHEPQMAEATN